MPCTQHSYLHGVVESFEHTHALGAELEVHGAFHGQGEALVLHGVLPTDDHHAREHLLGEDAATRQTRRSLQPPCSLAKASLFHHQFVQRCRHSPSTYYRSDARRPGEKGPGSGEVGVGTDNYRAGWAHNPIPSQPSRHIFISGWESPNKV